MVVVEVGGDRTIVIARLSLFPPLNTLFPAFRSNQNVKILSFLLFFTVFFLFLLPQGRTVFLTD